MERLKTIFVCVVAGVVCLGSFSHAAQISFQAQRPEIAVGDTVTLRVLLDTQGALINAVDLGLIYPKIFSIKNISKSGSFIQIWVKEPNYNKDEIFLSGGTPGGMTSQNALVATITLEAVSTGEGAIGLSSSSSVLLNDGLGSSAPLSVETSKIHVVPKKPGKTPQSLTQDLAPGPRSTDTTPPRGFSLQVDSDTRLFGGKYFVSFLSTDSDSGVERYEVKEGESPFAYARSPYLLSDQNLHSVIHVRAYDAAGNYREETYPNIFKRIWWTFKKALHI
jgi:hypothetical protein